MGATTAATRSDADALAVETGGDGGGDGGEGGALITVKFTSETNWKSELEGGFGG